MADAFLLVSPETLTHFGLSDPEAAAVEIAELVGAVFGPLDPAVAEVWVRAPPKDLSAADLRQIFAEAAAATDPLAFLYPYPDAWTRLRSRMRWAWSSRRARAAGHPANLEGQSWASLSEASREEVRGALRQLEGYEAHQVRRHRPKRNDFDTFLRELAEIYARHVVHTVHSTVVPHSPTSRFIQLADLVLRQLPLDASGQPWINRNLWTSSALSRRWKRIKALERDNGDES